ncbi:RNA binding (RRM/RBD/RNP motifs) family protein [Zea mays]|uniref:RNA binding (RRM/RBD/RNP motifs) family protein n=1 Tax=Zea mays TaxID=4577 RepID=A0A1D6JSD4_MAIZE|nr:RNA binding (RRM/RBD/RNP motifs) family protein [Zea mays]ONL94826.1 RNA binding (RRM/RBD/RNP motifs) family protein [Zea mays]
MHCAPSSNNCYLTPQICVWCWHHIIDMAEKEETKGRCPACRTRYDKDMIVKMAATCDRVIQRNLVYIIGLPAHLCNESVLERKEYFGQYGEVLKVLVSRLTGPPSQQASANSSISVYVSLNYTVYMHDLFILHMNLDFYFQYWSISLMKYQITIY